MSKVGKEGAPALAGWAGVTASTIAADRAGADDDAELEELAADALGAPERVYGWPSWLSTHGSRDSTETGPYDGLSASASRGASLGGAAEDGLRSDEDEMPPPGREEPSNDQPEESIQWS